MRICYMKTSTIFLIMIFSIITSGQDSKERGIKSTLNILGVPTYTKFNINNLSTWFQNNGSSDISMSGNSGFNYPKGSGKTAIYQSGFLWGGKVDGEVRVGGSTYYQGTVPGQIQANGTPANQSDPSVRIYRVKKDYKKSNMSTVVISYLNQNNSYNYQTKNTSVKSNLNWKSLGPYGGSISGFYKFPNGDILAFTAGGVYRTNDHGESWVWYLAPGYDYLTNSTGVIFCSRHGNVYSSTNNGITWETSAKIDSNLTLCCLDSLNNIYANDKNASIFRSKDNGNTWIKVKDKVVSDIGLFQGIVASKSGTLYTLEYSTKVYKSTDFGVTWDTTTSIPSKSGFPMRLAVNSKGDVFVSCYAWDTVFRSTDEGRSWQNFGAEITSPDLWSLYIDKDDYVYVGTSSCGVYRSTDNGETWHRMNLNMLLGVIVNGVIVDNDGYVFAGLQGAGVYRSGYPEIFSWSFKSKGISAMQVESLLKTDKYLFLGTERGGLFRTKDSGDNWELLGLQQFQVGAIKVDNKNNLLMGTEGGIWLSSDDGKTGTNLGLNACAWTFDFDENNRIVVGSYSWPPYYVTGIYYGDNYSSWTKCSSQNAYTIYYDKNSKLYYAMDGSCSYSIDRGISWNRLPVEFSDYNSLGGNAFSINSNSLGDLFVGTNKGVARSKDKGKSWKLFSSGLPSVYNTNADVYIDEFDNIFVSSSDFSMYNVYKNSVGVFISCDNGETWSGFTGVWPNQGCSMKKCYNDTLYVGTYGGGAYYLPNVFSKIVYIPPLRPVKNSFIPSDTVEFHWLTKPNINNYNIQIATDSLFNNIVNDTTVVDSVYKFNRTILNTRYFWRIRANSKYGWCKWSDVWDFTPGNPTSILTNSSVPTHFEICQNYPNPFNPSTTIRYDIPKESFVTLKIFNALGEEVKSLVNENKSAGSYEVKFDGSNLSSGVYFYRMTAGSFSQTKKLILMK